MRKLVWLALLLCCGTFSLCAGPKAQWLLYPEKLEDGFHQERFFRMEFEVPDKPVKEAFIAFIIDDYGTVLLNDNVVGCERQRRNSVPRARKFDVKNALVSGKNVIAATTVNTGHEGGLLLHLEITFEDGTIREFFSDDTWRTSKEKADGWNSPGFAAKDWKSPKIVGDYTVGPWWMMNDMLAFYAHDDAIAELERRRQKLLHDQKVIEELAKQPSEQSRIAYKNGSACFDIGGKLYRPVLYNSAHLRDSRNTREKIDNFAKADMNLIAIGIEASSFWQGPGKYDYRVLDRTFTSAYGLAPNARFLFAISFSHGPQWWNELHPEETIVYAQEDKEFSNRDNIGSYEAPSYASELWKKEASEVIQRIIEYIESKPYGKHVFAYRIDAGVYAEWHYYGMANSMPDVSAPMTKLLRSYLKDKYKGDVAALRKAWNQPEVTFDNAVPPPREVRLQYLAGTLRDPVKHARSIDFLHCMQLSLKNALLLMNRTAKEACKGRALVGNYCGYFFGMGYTAEGWHLVNDEFIRSPYVDFQVSPCCYSSFYRNLGSCQLSRGLTASYRLHNKINIFEADGRTHLAQEDGNKHVNTAQGSIAMLSRDLAQAISKGCAYWYYDFGRPWYNDPQILQYFHQIAPVYDAVKDFSSDADVAVIADWESAYYNAIQAPYGGPQGYMSINYLTHELKLAGMQFDAHSFADLDNPALQNYKLYIFPQLIYVTPEKLAKLAKLRKAGKSFLFLNTPGWLTPKGPDAGSIFQTTGIRAEVLMKKAGVTTTLKDGSVMDYFRMPDEIGWKISPVLKVTDPEATILGTVRTVDGKDVPSYARKKNADGTVSYVGGAPVMTSQELRKIAKAEGIHVYCDSEKGVVFANKSMISFHTGTPGEYTLKAKQPVKWTMVFPEKRSFPERQAAHTFRAPLPNTYIFTIEP